MLLIGTIPEADVEPVGLPQQNCSRTKQAMVSPKWGSGTKTCYSFLPCLRLSVRSHRVGDVRRVQPAVTLRIQEVDAQSDHHPHQRRELRGGINRDNHAGAE